MDPEIPLTKQTSSRRSIFSLTQQFSSRRFTGDQEQSDQGKFFNAVKKGDEQTATTLIGNIDLRMVDSEGHNALHIATTADKDKMVTFLLKSGMEVDSKTKDHEQKISEENLGQTALELAFTRGNPRTIKLLVKAGANLERVTHGQKNALTSVAVLYLNASSKNKAPFKEATIAVLDRMQPEDILKSLQYLVKERPKAAGFLIDVIREYDKSGVLHHDKETLMTRFTERFTPEQQESFNKVASEFKAEKVLGDRYQKSAAVTEIVVHTDIPSTSPSHSEQTKGCFQSLKSFLGLNRL